MKKLMIALCAAVLSTSVFAGAVTWKINYVVDPSTGADYTGGIAYLFNVADVSVATITEALAGGTFATDSLASQAIYTDSLEDGVLSNVGILSGVYSGSTTLFSVVLDGAYDYAAGGNYIVTSTATQSIGTSGSKTFKWDMDGTKADWTSYGGSSVPEPTSGLLMLLGVAGLALRRRRA